MGRGGMRFGAGRPGWLGKVEHCKSIDVRRFQREGMLSTGSWVWQWRDAATGEVTSAISVIGGAHHITLRYSVEGKSTADHINITRTACTVGGARAWFRCPTCSQRAAKLYLRFGRFACRACQHLAYGSQSDDAIGRAWRLQARLEAKLGPDLARPKHMHHATYEALRARIWDLEERRNLALCHFLARVGWPL